MYDITYSKPFSNHGPFAELPWVRPASSAPQRASPLTETYRLEHICIRGVGCRWQVPGQHSAPKLTAALSASRHLPRSTNALPCIAFPLGKFISCCLQNFMSRTRQPILPVRRFDCQLETGYRPSFQGFDALGNCLRNCTSKPSITALTSARARSANSGCSRAQAECMAS